MLFKIVRFVCRHQTVYNEAGAQLSEIIMVCLQVLRCAVQYNAVTSVTFAR